MNEVDTSRSAFHQSNEGQGLMSFINNFTSAENSTESGTLLYVNETEHQLNASNITNAADWRDAYKPGLDILLILILIVLMLSMGCDITLQNLLNHIRKPVGLCIGIFSQFGIMPLSAYCILLVSGITGLHATGVLIISCCPGGTLSNIFTYFCEGDLPLSVAMTSASTVIAIGMMPLNIWLYGRHFESSDLVIPYAKMAMSLISVTSPMIVGMLIKWKLPRIATFTTKLGGYSVLLMMFVCIGMEIVLFPNMFVGVPLKLYIVVLSLLLIGLTLGYGLAAVMKRKPQVRKTIAIECGIQNVPVALTIIALSFPREMQEDIVFLPWMYGFAMMSLCAVVSLTYQFCKKCSRKTNDDVETEVAETEDPLLGTKQEDEPKKAIKVGFKPFPVQNGKQTYEADSSV